jgi:hypothetical protein
MAKTSKCRTQKRTQKRRKQRGGSSGWLREPTFTDNLSTARYYPLQTQQTTTEQVGVPARLVGGRRSRRQRFSLRRRRQSGGFRIGGFADLASAYTAGSITNTGGPSQGVHFATVPPMTAVNIHPNGSTVSEHF